MSLVKFTISEFSSQSEKYLARNVLEDDSASWKCNHWQEYSWITLHAEKEIIVESIELINNSSAFVEVFTSKSADSNFQVLIPVFSTLSPSNSKTLKEDCKRRFHISAKNFSSHTKGEPCKLIKLVCSQPFNKKTKYGLLNVKIYGHDYDPVSNGESHNLGLGRFKLVERRSDNENNCFNYDLKRKMSIVKGSEEEKAKKRPLIECENESESVKGRTLTSTPSKKVKTTHSDDTPTSISLKDSHEKDEAKKRRKERNKTPEDDRDRGHRGHKDSVKKEKKERKDKRLGEEDRGKKRSNEIAEVDDYQSQSSSKPTKERHNHDKNKKEKKLETPEKEDKSRNKMKRSSGTINSINGNDDDDDCLPSTSKASSDSRHREKKSEKQMTKSKKPSLESVMAHVVFVLSGYENPQRSELRDKAVAMGAKYESKWSSHCTHLICAFTNTPKYREVKQQNGRIVSEKWIEDSYARGELLEWRNYMVGTYGGPDTPPRTSNGGTGSEDQRANSTNGRMAREQNDDSDVIYDLDTEDDSD